MNATTLLAEILVTGFLALFSLALCLGKYVKDHETLYSCLQWFMKNQATAAVSFIAGCYLAGWIVNTIGALLTETQSVGRMPKFLTQLGRFLTDRREKFFSQGGTPSYEECRQAVFQRGSKALLDDLLADRTRIRLARGSAMNFLILGVVLLPMSKWLAAIAFVAAILAAFHFWEVWKRYYRRMAKSYIVL